MKNFTKKWGSWAVKTCMFSLPSYRCNFFKTKSTLVLEKNSEEETEDEDGGTSKLASPEERYLEKGPDEPWALRPLPESRNMLSADLGRAVHIYITQQWSMAGCLLSRTPYSLHLLELMGGSKRVAWKDIKAAPRQYISTRFILDRHAFNNPTHLHDCALRAYWKHWYGLAQSGHPFSFKAVVAADSTPGESEEEEQAGGAGKIQPLESDEDTKNKGSRPAKGENPSPGARLGKSNRSDLVKDQDPVEEEDSGLDKSSPGADEKVSVPDECSTEGEKITFLCSPMDRLTRQSLVQWFS